MAIGFHFDDIEWESYYNEQGEFLPKPYETNVNMSYKKLEDSSNKECKLWICSQKQFEECDTSKLENGFLVFIVD